MIAANRETKMIEIPVGAIERDGNVYNSQGNLIELYEGRWRAVLDGARQGWWRYHQHYDRDGYCDNPARGY